VGAEPVTSAKQPLTTPGVRGRLPLCLGGVDLSYLNRLSLAIRDNAFGRHKALRPDRLTAILLSLSLALGLLVPLAAPVSADSLTGYTWTEYASNPIFSGVNRAYYPRVIEVAGTYQMWYGDMVGGFYQLGHTSSVDGVTWSAPSIVTGLTGQPNHPVVVNVGSDASPHYRIWYGDVGTWPAGSACLLTAESDDGQTWYNCTPIGEDPNAGLLKTDNASDPAYNWRYGTYGPAAALYNPSGYASLNNADPMGNKYVMYYDMYSRTWITNVQEATGLAISADGVTWSRYGNGPVLNAAANSTTWDGQYAYAWSVIKQGSAYHMWYSGGIAEGNQGVGYASSADGLTWTKDPDPVMRIGAGVPAWRVTRTYTPCVLQEDGIYKMWLTGVGSSGYRVGYAVAVKPSGNPTDPVGTVRNSYYQREDVWCGGSGFFPNSYVDVYIVDYVDIWTENMSIPTPRGGTPVTVHVGSDGSLPLTEIWTSRLTAGHYDVFFDANQDGKYESAVDVDPPFWVYPDPAGPVSTPAFPSIYVGIAAALGAGAAAYLVRARLAKRSVPRS
jgi:hypothetical protein